MRILATVDHWGLVGGSERYAGEVVQALAARGHELSVLAGALREPALSLPGRCELAVDPAYSAERPSRAERERLARAAALRSPDAILVLTCFRARTFETLLDAAPVVRFVQDHALFCPSLNKLWTDGTPCDLPLGVACLERYFLGAGCASYRPAGRVRPWIEGVGELKKKWLEFQSARRARRLVVASRYMQQELLRAGAASDRVRVVPYFTRSNTPAIPREAPAPELARFLAGAGAPVVFTPARLVLPDKGIDVLLEALALLRCPFRAVIAGDGPARAALEHQSRRLGLASRVHFAGWQSPGEIESLYARADLVAFPSVWNEPFGLVGIEAMAHGKPVAAFDVGGVREWLVPESTGLVVPRADAAGMARAIERLLLDRELAARLGAAGAERARSEYGLELHLERLEAALRT